jgi:hypothetical protein
MPRLQSSKISRVVGLAPDHPGYEEGDRWLRQRSEQYFTSSQQAAHFLRQVKGRWHTGQILVGKSDFLRCLAISLDLDIYI